MSQLSSIETEERMIAAMLYDYHGCIAKSGLLLPTHFSIRKNMIIFEAICSAAATGDVSDMICISEKSEGTISFYELMEISDRFIPTINFVEIDFKTLDDYRKRRELCQILSKRLPTIDQNTMPEDFMEEIQNSFSELQDISPSIKLSLYEQSNIWADELTNRYDGKHTPGLITGYYNLDDMTGGLVPGNLIIIGARPGVGKTSMALNIARNVVKSDSPVGFISLEMTSLELIEKLITMEGKIDGSVLKRSEIDKSVFSNAISLKSKIEQWPLFISDADRNILESLIHRTRMLVSRYKIKLLVIDYLQLIVSGKLTENRNNEISTITRALKQLAQKEKIPIILLSQLNRASNKSKPQLSGLKDSGAIEQDANIVILLHANYEKQPNVLGAYVAKNRSGRTGPFKLTFLRENGLIANYAEEK